MVYKDKEKQKETRRKWYKEHYKKNHDKIRSQAKARYKPHPKPEKSHEPLTFQPSERTLKTDEVNIKRREYYRENFERTKEKINARRRELYKQNPEKYLNKTSQWHKDHPEYQKDYYTIHHKVSVTNKNRTPKMWTAQAIASKIPIKPFCELCPEIGVDTRAYGAKWSKFNNEDLT